MSNLIWPAMAAPADPSDAAAQLRRTPGEFARGLLSSARTATALLVVVIVIASAVFAPLLATYSPLAGSPDALLPPGARDHILGTDQLGRDIWSELVYGARVSLVVGFAAAAMATMVGTAVGAVAGYVGGVADTVLMRITEVFQTLPRLVVAIVVVALFGSGITKLIIIIAIFAWPQTARVVRVGIMTARQAGYVEAARLGGMPPALILLREILPNVLPSIVVVASLDVSEAILTEAALSFFGLGDPNLPSWGRCSTRRRSTSSKPGGWRSSLDWRWPWWCSPSIFWATASTTCSIPVRWERGGERAAHSDRPARGDGQQARTSHYRRRRQPRGQARRDSRPRGRVRIGKSVTALAVAGLLSRRTLRVTGGSVELAGAGRLDQLPDRALRAVRGGRIGFVFQDPMTHLDPLMTIGRQVRQGLRAHHFRGDMDARVIELLVMMRLPDPRRIALRYPNELSGGQRQRALIAAALAAQPDLLIADEPSTSLDVTIQASILALLDRLRREQGIGVLLITHDLGVVAETCDRVYVMYGGQVVEHRSAAELFADPRHPYTSGLIRAMLTPHAGLGDLFAMPGTVPEPGRLPPGCRFYGRCPLALDKCATEPPPAHAVVGGMSACWRAGEQGIQRAWETQ